MPKTAIDYSNTIIYKITCKDTGVKDVYVGHTTNFVQRKHAHKQSCINSKSPNHNCKLYKIMRENGGWTNWIMEIVHFFNCNDHYEARIKEQEYFILLNATLNSIEPMPKPKPTIKTLPDVIEMPENASKYHCKTCDFNCGKERDWSRHLATTKHNIRKSTNENTLKHANKYSCNCSKTYKHASSLWNHLQKCETTYLPTAVTVDTSNNFVCDKELLMSILKQNSEIIKENSELKIMMMEVIKTGTHIYN